MTNTTTTNNMPPDSKCTDEKKAEEQMPLLSKPDTHEASADTTNNLDDTSNDNKDGSEGPTAEDTTEPNDAIDKEIVKDESVSAAPPSSLRTDFPISSQKTLCGFSLDKDVQNVDVFLYRMCIYVILAWLILISISYYAAPNEAIVRIQDTEKNALIIEIIILATAVVMRHGPLLWDMKRESAGYYPPRISGVLAGGLTVQFIAMATVVWMLFLPVPVMMDPVFHSRVHLLRWCEWTPLAGFMTLLMECIDAPVVQDGTWSSRFKRKLFSASMESLSTVCAMFFPFCTSKIYWGVLMVTSFLFFFHVFYSYARKAREFRKIVRGRSEDHIELYERSRLSLALHRMCCIAWTLITVSFFVGSCGHLVAPVTWTWIHDPSIMMIEECIMDCVAKILYMNLIIEADAAAFDEVKRANRRLAELKNTMSVVWENSSDTIAISVQKISGNVTSMISPSFFREALIAKHQKLNDISAVVMEMENPSAHKRTDSFTNVAARVEIGDLPSVGMKIIRKEDFARLDLHSQESQNIFDPIVEQPLLTNRVLAFNDMMYRAWHSKTAESVFEHDVDHPKEGSKGPRTKFEVKVTRLDEHAIVVVIRDVSERYRRFEAEKRFVIETTARQKDAEANKFTRHEVKNGILSAIEICSTIREQLSADFSKLQTLGGQITANEEPFSEESLSAKMDSITELDMTLHEVLDTVLAETMARDVIHEMYQPKMNRVDVSHLLSHMKGFAGSSDQFEFVFDPSPLPLILSDHGLLKCVYSNAIRNAIKYGEPGGKITTVATYSSEGILKIKITNLPGPGHQKLVDLGSRACDLVFSHGTRLHQDTLPAMNSISAGDGAWIIRKCATILGGTVDISFEHDKTVFVFEAPAELYNASSEANTFVIPSGVWGIAIDDSKIQRKLLRRFFVHAGIPWPNQIILGQKPAEILKFEDFVVNFVTQHPNDRFFVIVDENLELGGDDSDVNQTHETISGSKCIQRIRLALDSEDESRVLATVRSANDSPSDMALYLSRAHGYIPKVPLRVLSVKTAVYELWKKRFPEQEGNEGSTENSKGFSRVSSLENLRDLTLISAAELLDELEQIDAYCIRDHSELNIQDRWHGLWDKLHQLKGDLKSANIDERYSEPIKIIESMRGQEAPTDFLAKWLSVRSKVVAYGRD